MKDNKKKKKKNGGKLAAKENKKSRKKKNRAEDEFWPEEEAAEEWYPEEEPGEEWYPEEEPGEEWYPEEEATEEWYPEEEPANDVYSEEEMQDSGIEVIEIGDGMFEEEEDYMDELIRSKKLENQPSLAQKRGQDERAMIREQERLAQEKKRKKRNKRRNIAVGVIAAVLVVGVWFIGWGYSLIFRTNTDTSTVEIVVESGQEVVYAKLTSVKGNEITYTVAQAVETADEAESTQEGGEVPSNETASRSAATSLTANSTDSYTAVNLGMGGDMGGGFGGGNMGGDGSFDFGSFDFSGFGDGSSSAVTSSASDTFTYDDVTYQLTEETNTMQIPVGTDVTTRLGTVTTFSRLAAGDCVALVMQEVDGEDVIMAVYIIG